MTNQQYKLDAEDLKIIHERDVYEGFLHSFIIDSPESIEKALSEYSKWRKEHRLQLCHMYLAAGYKGTMIDSHHFYEWSRKIFYIWKANLHHKKEMAEIEKMTEVDI